MPRERRSALRALKRTSCKAPPPAHQGPGAEPAEPSQDKLAPANREHETARGDCAENLGGDGDGQKNELGHGAGHSADRQKTAHMKYFSGYDKPRGICTTRGRPSPQPARHARRGTRTASSSASHRRSARRGESRAVASRKTRWLMRCMRAAYRRRRPTTPRLRASPLPASPASGCLRCEQPLFWRACTACGLPQSPLNAAARGAGARRRERVSGVETAVCGEHSKVEALRAAASELSDSCRRSRLHLELIAPSRALVSLHRSLRRVAPPPHYAFPLRIATPHCAATAAMRKQKRGPEMFRMSRRASTKESIDDATSEHERLASLTESMRAELAATREELRQSMTEVMANAPAPARSP